MIIKGNSVGYPLPDPRKGMAMQGNINMNGNSLSGIKTPETADDAANKGYVDSYVDSYVNSKHFFRNVTLTVAGWSADAPYKQTVTAQGITTEDRPVYGVVLSADAATATAEKEAFAMVDDLDTGTNVVTFTCLEEKPEVALTIQMEVNR